jgi:hypothetical protein
MPDRGRQLARREIDLDQRRRSARGGSFAGWARAIVARRIEGSIGLGSGGKRMLTYILALPGSEVVRLFRAEWEAAFGQPELNTSLWTEYAIEEGFAGGSHTAPDAKKSDLVTAVSTLSIEVSARSEPSWCAWCNAGF